MSTHTDKFGTWFSPGEGYYPILCREINMTEPQPFELDMKPEIEHRLLNDDFQKTKDSFEVIAKRQAEATLKAARAYVARRKAEKAEEDDEG